MQESDLVRVILAWWEAEAERVANCAKPDPALCGNHVFEEAVRVDGTIVACTVHGDRLARSLAAHLAQVGREEEERQKRLAEKAFRMEREGNWPPGVHGTPPPGGARLPVDATGVRQVYGPGCVVGCDSQITGRHARDCRVPETGNCGGRYGGGRCRCLTAQEHFQPIAHAEYRPRGEHEQSP